MPEFWVGALVGLLIGAPTGALTLMVVAFVATRPRGTK